MLCAQLKKLKRKTKMTDKKIKIVDYSNYDKLFKDYQKRKPDFEKFKQEAQNFLYNPDVSDDYKNNVRTLLNGLDKLTKGIERLEHDIAVQKRIDEIAWHSIELCNKQTKHFVNLKK